MLPPVWGLGNLQRLAPDVWARSLTSITSQASTITDDRLKD